MMFRGFPWHQLTVMVPHEQDSEAVLEHLVTRGEAGRALALLRRPGVPQELSYKFAPALVAAAPAETVDAWMAAQPALNPRRVHHLGTAAVMQDVCGCSTAIQAV